MSCNSYTAGDSGSFTDGSGIDFIVETDTKFGEDPSGSATYLHLQYDVSGATLSNLISSKISISIQSVAGLPGPSLPTNTDFKIGYLANDTTLPTDLTSLGDDNSEAFTTNSGAVETFSFNPSDVGANIEYDITTMLQDAQSNYSPVNDLTLVVYNDTTGWEATLSSVPELTIDDGSYTAPYAWESRACPSFFPGNCPAVVNGRGLPIFVYGKSPVGFLGGPRGALCMTPVGLFRKTSNSGTTTWTELS